MLIEAGHYTPMVIIIDGEKYMVKTAISMSPENLTNAKLAEIYRDVYECIVHDYMESLPSTFLNYLDER
jgi:predicted Zn-dependent protease